MPLIVLNIPRFATSASSMAAARLAVAAVGQASEIAADTLPFIAGECMLTGYENMIVAENVTWNIEIEETKDPDGRRTIHTPKLSLVTIERHFDRASGQISRIALQTKVSPAPWEITFLTLVPLGIPLLPVAMPFMTMTLSNALISKMSVDFTEGEPKETLEVSATAIQWTYYELNASQAITGRKQVGYDMQAQEYF